MPREPSCLHSESAKTRSAYNIKKTFDKVYAAAPQNALAKGICIAAVFFLKQSALRQNEENEWIMAQTGCCNCSGFAAQLHRINEYQLPVAHLLLTHSALYENELGARFCYATLCV